MVESTKIWTTSHRGIEIKFWQTVERWFDIAAGQESGIYGYPTLRAALQNAFEFINDSRGIGFHSPSISSVSPQNHAITQATGAQALERNIRLPAAGK